MAMPANVSWVETDPANTRIMSLGGTTRSLFGRSEWALTADEAISLIEMDEWHFFVTRGDSRHWLEVDETDEGRKILTADPAVLPLA